VSNSRKYNILFIHLPFKQGFLNPFRYYLSWSLPPLGLLYLSTILNNKGHFAEIADFTVEPLTMNNLANYINGKDLIGISVFRHNRDQIESFISKIRSINEKVPIICGGPDITLKPAIFKGSQASVLGEPEETIEDIVDAVCSEGDLSKCPGTMFYEHNSNKIRTGPPFKLPTYLDSLVFPNRKLLNRYNYKFISNKTRGKIALMITSRGCPFNCSFCARPKLFQHSYRTRSNINIMQELKMLCNEGFEYIFFGDSVFAINYEKTESLMEEIINSGIKPKIIFNSHASLANESLMALFEKAGVYNISYGFESANEETLKYFKKNTTVAQNYYAADLTSKKNIYVTGNFIIGAENETSNEIIKTIDFSRSGKIDVAYFSILFYRYGSILWEKAVSEGKIDRDQLDLPSTKRLGLGRLRAMELKNYIYLALIRFYLRPSYLIRQFSKSLKVNDSEYLCLSIKMAINSLFLYLVYQAKKLIHISTKFFSL